LPCAYKTRLGYLEGVLSIGLNTALFGLKYWVGVSTGSIAVIADAWHTMSDTLTSVIVILGFKISSIGPDKKHPFGHGRAEIIASVVIGVLLAVVGFNFFVESIHRFVDRRVASFNSPAVAVFAVSVVLKEALSRFSLWAGKKIGSQSLIADGWHHRSDSIASLLILLGMLFGRYIWWIDSSLGIAVSLLIFYAAFGVMKESTGALMGEQPGKQLSVSLNRIVRDTSQQVQNVHHVHVHRYGDHVEITFHIKLKPEMDLEAAHRISLELEDRIKRDLNMAATIHIEPST
jgi:cation diffusion facilitator family transporter